MPHTISSRRFHLFESQRTFDNYHVISSVFLIAVSFAAHIFSTRASRRYVGVAWTRAPRGPWATLLAMQMQSTVRWCVRDEETSEVKDCAERSVALRGSKEWTEREGERRRRRRRWRRRGEEEGPAFSEIIVLAISVSRRQRTRFICRVYCR